MKLAILKGFFEQPVHTACFLFLLPNGSALQLVLEIMLLSTQDQHFNCTDWILQQYISV